MGMQPQQPSAHLQTQPYMQQSPSQLQMNYNQQQQQPPPGQPQPVLHRNLFAGVVPGAAPIPTPVAASTSTGLFGASHQQDDDDLFSAFATPAAPQPMSVSNHDPFASNNHDPFANQFTPPPTMAQAPLTAQPPQDTYFDPFSGL